MQREEKWSGLGENVAVGAVVLKTNPSMRFDFFPQSPINIRRYYNPVNIAAICNLIPHKVFASRRYLIFRIEFTFCFDFMLLFLSIGINWDAFQMALLVQRATSYSTDFFSSIHDKIALGLQLTAKWSGQLLISQYKIKTMPDLYNLQFPFCILHKMQNRNGENLQKVYTPIVELWHQL